MSNVRRILAFLGLAGGLMVVCAGCSRDEPAVERPIMKCADHPALSNLKGTYGIVMLVAAADVVAGGDSICDAVLPDFWTTYEPIDMADNVAPDTLAAALEWVCGRVLALPEAEQNVSIAKLQAWCDVNEWIGTLTLEPLATAVAFVPEVEDLLAGKIAERRIPKERIGDSLASAEHTELHYELTRRLASLPEARRAEVMTALQHEIGKYGEE